MQKKPLEGKFLGGWIVKGLVLPPALLEKPVCGFRLN
jgi:hypothetical protein